jgi:acyl-CoA synthetase (AMP-forming)/AMP-acid ligase II
VKTIPALFTRAAARFGGAEAVVDDEVRLTWTELDAAVERAAAAFVAAGLQPGDRVAIWAPNIHEWIVAMGGLLRAGGIVVPLNTRYKGAEASYILRASRARLLLAVEGFLGNEYVTMLLAATASEPLEHLDGIVVLRGETPDGTTSWADFLAAGDGVDAGEIQARAAALGPESVGDIIFTSGTTGNPKGVVTTHGQTLRAFAEWSGILGLRDDDRYLIINPFFHTFGYKAGILASLMRGATMVPQAVFDAEEAMRRIAIERITMLPGPPTLYQTILAHPERAQHDLSSLRLAATGAAVIPVQLVRDMWEVLGFETVVTAYGLTEATGVVTMCRPGDEPETIANTSGRAITDVEVAIVDDDGSALPPGTPGEVVVRGYNVMREYFEAPEQTAEAIDADGWLHTGDIGVLDERGYLDITDRKKDMFIVGGFNAYPAEIEQLLGAHPDIAQCAVVGVPDERMGEVAYAFVVAAPGAAPVVDEIVAWAREQMANFKVPRYVELVDALPLNPSGKVLKYELRDRARATLGA